MTEEEKNALFEYLKRTEERVENIQQGLSSVTEWLGKISQQQNEVIMLLRELVNRQRLP